jgi:uncharacterized protein
VDALSAEPLEALQRLFFTGTAPLAADGSGWLLEALRGRYDPLLRYLAGRPGATRADIAAHTAETAGHSSSQVGAWLVNLEERFRLVERARPAFAAPRARDGRYRTVDNFLLAWLGALATTVAFQGLRPIRDLVVEARTRLFNLEGPALERLVASLYHERSQRALADFPLDGPVRGWWDRRGSEVDWIAISSVAGKVRVGSAKRSPERLIADLPRFDGHVVRLLELHPELGALELQKVALAPRLSPLHRAAIERAGFLPQDLHDLLAGLLP